MEERIVPTNVDPETGFGRYEIKYDGPAQEALDGAQDQRSEGMALHVPPVTVTEAPARRQSRRERHNRPRGRIRTGLRRIGYTGAAGLMLLGALQVAGDFGFDLGDIIPGDGATAEASAGDVHTDVEEWSGIVTADLHSTVDINVERTLNHVWPLPDCTIAVHEDNVSLSGLLTVGLSGMQVVTNDDKTVTATVTKFETPRLGLPLDDPVLPEGSGTSACIQKDAKEKADSPENVPVVIAGKLLKASSQRIGECVINRANDKGTDVQRLLAGSIAQTVASIKGIDPEKVHVSFNFEDTDEGKKAIERVKKQIIAEQKETAGAKMTIETVEVEACKLHDISTTLSKQATSES